MAQATKKSASAGKPGAKTAGKPTKAPLNKPALEPCDKPQAAESSRLEQEDGACDDGVR